MQKVDERQRQLVNQTAAIQIGTTEWLVKGALGAAVGVAGVLGLNQISPSFRAIRVAPIKVALVTMAALGSGTYFSESKVTAFAQGQVPFPESPSIFPSFQLPNLAPSLGLGSKTTFTDIFHDYKFRAIGAMWASTIVASLYRNSGKEYIPFYQRLIRARLAAQSLTVVAIGLTGAACYLAPDERPRAGSFATEHAAHSTPPQPQPQASAASN